MMAVFFFSLLRFVDMETKTPNRSTSKTVEMGLANMVNRQDLDMLKPAKM